jgi:hypothetical protein
MKYFLSILFLVFIHLTTAARAHQDTLRKQHYRCSALLINDMIDTKLEARFDYPNSSPLAKFGSR